MFSQAITIDSDGARRLFGDNIPAELLNSNGLIEAVAIIVKDESFDPPVLFAEDIFSTPPSLRQTSCRLGDVTNDTTPWNSQLFQRIGGCLSGISLGWQDASGHSSWDDRFANKNIPVYSHEEFMKVYKKGRRS